MNKLKNRHFMRFMVVAIFTLTAIKTQVQKKIQKTSFDSLVAVREIANQSRGYAAALSQSDSVAVASFYTADARIINPDSPSTIGTAALVHFYGAMIRNGITGFAFTTTGVFGSDNDLVVEDGTLVFSLSTGKAVMKGRYLLVWKRVNGVLKIFRDSLSSDGKVAH